MCCAKIIAQALLLAAALGWVTSAALPTDMDLSTRADLAGLRHRSLEPAERGLPAELAPGAESDLLNQVSEIHRANAHSVLTELSQLLRQTPSFSAEHKARIRELAKQLEDLKAGIRGVLDVEDEEAQRLLLQEAQRHLRRA